VIKIEYWNDYDILDVHYEGSYHNWFWLNVDMLKPEYPIFREQIEDSYGDAHNTFLKWEKQYSFEVFCTENMVDFISTLTLHTQVWIELDNGYSGKARDFNMEVEWTSIPSVAKVKCIFSVKAYHINGASASHC
jgi:hypothetical protein